MSELWTAYIELLLAENQKHNLISRHSGPEEVQTHIQDSLALLSFIPPEQLQGLSLIDIGSGAGFPGLMLGIACPQLKVTLMESDLKKSGFLRLAAAELKLDNVQVVRERAEVVGQDPQWRAQFDLCSSRAVAETRVLLEYGLPLLKVQGRQLLWKSSSYEAEMTAAKAALHQLHGQWEDSYHYQLADSKERYIVCVRKNAATPKAYPRRTGTPGKHPL